MDANQVGHGKRPVRVLHLVGRFDADEDGSLILDICSIKQASLTRFEHAIHSLEHPSGKGVARARERGMDVDQGSGSPMLQYRLKQADLVVLYWKNKPILHQFLAKALIFPKLVVWNTRGGCSRGHGLPNSLWARLDKYVHPRPGDLREVLTQLASAARKHAEKITQLIQPDRFESSNPEGLPQDSLPVQVGCIGPILKQDYQDSWMALQLDQSGSKRRILVGTHGDTSWIRDQVYSSPQPESFEIHPILCSENPFLEQLHKL